MPEVAHLHYAWGGRLCLHPFNLGFCIALSRDSKIPNLKEFPPVALRQKQKALFKIAICVRTQRVRAKSRFKWKRALPAAPRVVEKTKHSPKRHASRE